MTLKPWREVAIPHKDVREGTFVQAEYAADISKVHSGTASEEYQDPRLFFQRTFITEGMRLLLDSVVKRLSGRGGDPVIQLQTAFGGGKTHTMLAVYHLAKGQASASELAGISSILDAANITELPKATIAVLDGIKSSPNQPQSKEGLTIRTLWGDLAYQLGGSSGYAMVADADASGTSPGKETLEQLIAKFSPSVILIDELVAYIRQFEEGQQLTGGTFDSNLTFIQALTEALKGVPNAILLASLPESDKEAGSQRGVKALAALSHYFGRVQALWKPVATEEAFEIVRRRLFSEVTDQLMAESVCREFVDYYQQNSGDFPRETQERHYYDRMLQAYPIHPEVFDRLYNDWSSLDNFQRTRGVLKLMAKVIHNLWHGDNRDLMIMPGSFPLNKPDARNDLIYYLPQGWDPVIERDVDGERAETTAIENADSRFGSLQACRRTARTIFLGSAPSTGNQLVRGIELERILLGVAQPQQTLGTYKDALRRLSDKLHYLNSGNNRFWFDTRPNLRKEMEDRKRRFEEKTDVYPHIRERINKSFASGVFAGIHVFANSQDIPDDWGLRLVVTAPDQRYSKIKASITEASLLETLKKRGEQPRFKQNRLIFLCADDDGFARLADQVRAFLAWQSIVNDGNQMKITLDNLMTKQAKDAMAQAEETIKRMVKETYKWLLVPFQEAKPGQGVSEVQWESYALNSSAANLTQEIERVLKENELLITEWSPFHLHNLLKSWFWKSDQPAIGANLVWQQTCQQLYLPRLRDSMVYQNTIGNGVQSRDFFGLAQGKDGDKYVGFVFGKTTSVILDEYLLLIEPQTAHDYEASLLPPPTVAPTPTIKPGIIGPNPTIGPQPTIPPTLSPTAKPTQFYASVELDALRARAQFADIFEEVIQQFASKPGVKVTISIDLSAESASGFDDSTQRAVKENCSVLKFRSAEFEG